METMAVVVIIGILSAIAVYSVRRYILSAKSAEARQMISAIKAAEETYREETYVYKSASAAGITAPGSMYPQVCVDSKAPAQRKYSWDQPGTTCADAKAWREIGVTTTTAVQYGYAVVAVNAGAQMPTVGQYNWGASQTAPGPAFAVVARGDLDADEVYSTFLGSNFTDEIYVQQEDE